MTPFDFRPRTRILFGPGEFARLGEIARELGGTRCLLVADQGMVDAGYAQEAVRSLKARRMDVFAFYDFAANPTTTMVETGARYAAPHNVNLVVGLGGGSSLDCAKAINLLLTSGGALRDYWGYGKAKQPLHPMLAVPTTAGPGSEAQTHASIIDETGFDETGIDETGVDAKIKTKMSFGDARIVYRTAILDPRLSVSQPAAVTAAAGFDAIAHAIETLISTRRNAASECFSREAWRLLNINFERVLKEPEDENARGAMLIGAHFAGLAAENAMLGAAHACAEPLTAHYGLAHGVAVSLVLPHVIDWSEDALPHDFVWPSGADIGLPERLRELARRAQLPLSLRDANVPEGALPRLAEEAAVQWTGKFSPRKFDAEAALEIYRAAYA
jgi:alcohol dehydrogenase